MTDDQTTILTATALGWEDITRTMPSKATVGTILARPDGTWIRIVQPNPAKTCDV